MGKLKNGIFGPITGKIGPIVAIFRNNKVYVRSMPKKSLKPRTAGQIAAQEKFKLAHEVIRPLKPYIRAGFKHLASYKSEMDLAYPIIYHRAILGTYPDLDVDYSQLVVSEGRLMPLKAPVMVLAPTNILSVTWDVVWTPYSKIDDQLMLVLNCPDLGVADGMINIVNRFQQECKFAMPPRMIGYEVDIYVALISKNLKHASNSQYLGRVMPV